MYYISWQYTDGTWDWNDFGFDIFHNDLRVALGRFNSLCDWEPNQNFRLVNFATGEVIKERIAWTR